MEVWARRRCTPAQKQVSFVTIRECGACHSVLASSAWPSVSSFAFQSATLPLGTSIPCHCLFAWMGLVLRDMPAAQYSLSNPPFPSPRLCTWGSFTPHRVCTALALPSCNYLFVWLQNTLTSSVIHSRKQRYCGRNCHLRYRGPIRSHPLPQRYSQRCAGQGQEPEWI